MKRNVFWIETEIWIFLAKLSFGQLCVIFSKTWAFGNSERCRYPYFFFGGGGGGGGACPY